MICTQLILSKTLSLEFNVVKLVIWMVADTISFIFYPKFKVLELLVCKEKVEQKLFLRLFNGKLVCHHIWGHMLERV